LPLEVTLKRHKVATLTVPYNYTCLPLGSRNDAIRKDYHVLGDSPLGYPASSAAANAAATVGVTADCGSSPAAEVVNRERTLTRLVVPVATTA
jgi:hypothetical protein